MQNQNILTVRNVSKNFNGNIVLDNVNLEVKKGDIYGILGLSGAGKSTLVRCMNGLEIPTTGEILFKDEVICSNKVKITNETRNKISMIFQSFNLLSQKTVLDNVLLAMHFSNKKPTFDKNTIFAIKEKFKAIKKTKESKRAYKEEINRVKYQEAFEMLERVGIADKWDSYPSQLSGGQQQRVAIARALMTKPEILLCDEATSALDPDPTASILDLLHELNKTLGLTIIIISHQMTVVEAICNKVAVIYNAKIVEQGNLSDIFLNPKTDISKKLIYSDKVKTKLSNENLIRLTFDGNIDEPIIANIVQDCSILVSIVHANSQVIDNKIYGQIVFKLPYYEKEINKLKQYLSLKNIKFEEVGTHEL